MSRRGGISCNTERTAKNQALPIEKNIASRQEQAETYLVRSLG